MYIFDGYFPVSSIQHEWLGYICCVCFSNLLLLLCQFNNTKCSRYSGICLREYIYIYLLLLMNHISRKKIVSISFLTTYNKYISLYFFSIRVVQEVNKYWKVYQYHVLVRLIYQTTFCIKYKNCTSWTTYMKYVDHSGQYIAQIVLLWQFIEYNKYIYFIQGRYIIS